jgi:Spy/CpxP family protein refolding chaperone
MKQTTHSSFRLTRAVAVALALATAALVLLGVGVHPAQAGNGGGMGAHHGRNHAEHFTARIAAALGLSEQQKAAAAKLHEEAAAKAKPLRERARLQHEEIEAMLEAGSASPNELGERMIELYATHKQLEALHEQTRARLSAQLSAEQRAKFEKLHKEQAGRPGGHGPGGLGHCMGAPDGD